MKKIIWVQNEIIKVSDKILTNHDYQLLNEAKQVGGFQNMQLIGIGPQEGENKLNWRKLFPMTHPYAWASAQPDNLELVNNIAVTFQELEK